MASLRIAHIFIEGKTNSLKGSPFYLNGCKIGIYWSTYIGYRYIVNDLDFACFLVELYFDKAC